jgi:hypothetical protein
MSKEGIFWKLRILDFGLRIDQLAKVRYSDGLVRWRAFGVKSFRVTEIGFNRDGVRLHGHIDGNLFQSPLGVGALDCLNLHVVRARAINANDAVPVLDSNICSRFNPVELLERLLQRAVRLRAAAVK